MDECPTCQVVEVRPPRFSVPHWVTLIIVVAIFIILCIGAYAYLRSWSHERSVGLVKDDLATASDAATKNNVKVAVQALESATRKLDWFDENDPQRDILNTEILDARKALREKLESTLENMVLKGDPVEAQSLYENQAKAIDNDGSLRDAMAKALKARQVFQDVDATVKLAEKSHAAGTMGAALTQISEARRKAQVAGSTGGKAVAELRKKSGELEDEGKLDQAMGYFDVAIAHLSGEAVRRGDELKERVYQIKEHCVVGLVVNVTKVRVVKPEAVQKELLQKLDQKLKDGGFRALVVTGPQDPKAVQLDRLLVADYSEDKGREFISETGTEKAAGTVVNCVLKIINRDGGTSLWDTKVTAETSPTEFGGKGELTEKSLRENAMLLFWAKLDGTLLGTTYLKP
jgi:hypothetical protein